MIYRRIPHNDAVAMQWTKAIRRVEIVEKSIGGMICIEHFVEKDFKRKDKYRIELKPVAVPSIFADMNEINSHDQNIYCVDINSQSCVDCLEKDQLITELGNQNENLHKLKDGQNEIIIRLRGTIKSLHDKVNYLEAAKAKFKEAAFSSKAQKVSQEYLGEKLKVFIIYHRVI